VKDTYFLTESAKIEGDFCSLIQEKNLQIDAPTRALLTLAMVAANLQLDYVGKHVERCAEAGLGRTDVAELLVQLYCYAGVYPALAAFKIAAQTFKKLESEGKLTAVQSKLENQRPPTTTYADRVADGLNIRRRLFGEASIDAVLSQNDELEHVFNELTHEFCFGNIWARPYFTKQLRSQVCLAIAAATGQHGAIGRHTRSALLGGVSKQRIAEIFCLAGIYGGLYNAQASFAVGQKIYDELLAEGWKDVT